MTAPIFEVIDPIAPLRRAPRPDAPLDTEALYGEEVLCLDPPHEGWMRVRLELDGYEGYVPDASLRPLASGRTPTHMVRAPRSLLYPAPDFKRPPVGALTMGAVVSVAGFEGEYARLDTGAFIAACHLVAFNGRGGDFVDVAETLLHVPYLWGGKSGLGIDCSGLVQLSLLLTGIKAPRDSGPQGRELGMIIRDNGPQGRELGMIIRDNGLQGREPGALVSEGALPADIRRGDLLFWKDHVAIARDDTTMIHANVHHMCVAIEDMRAAIARIAAKDNPLLRVRRIAGQAGDLA